MRFGIRIFSPKDSCLSPIRTMPKVAWSSPRSTSRKLRSRKGAISLALTSSLTSPTTSCQSFLPLFLTTRPDLGDVSQGKLVTLDNFFEFFNGILNPKQLEGLRLLVTPFPQQQFNHTKIAAPNARVVVWSVSNVA
jgi:hypothetical protein